MKDRMVLCSFLQPKVLIQNVHALFQNIQGLAENETSQCGGFSLEIANLSLI